MLAPLLMCQVSQLDTDAVTFASVRGPQAYYFNMTFMAHGSAMVDLSVHPGFGIQPLYWCSNPNNLKPHAGGFFSVATPAELEDTLSQVSGSLCHALLLSLVIP